MALENLMKKRTSLVSPQTFYNSKADRILVLDKGAIVEVVHDELLKKGKVYKSWVALQKL